MTESEPTSGKNPKPVKRLYRSGQQKVVAGVCGGLAEYFQVDVAIMRIIWILFTLAGGDHRLPVVLANCTSQSGGASHGNRCFCRARVWNSSAYHRGANHTWGDSSGLVRTAGFTGRHFTGAARADLRGGRGAFDRVFVDPGSRVFHHFRTRQPSAPLSVEELSYPQRSLRRISSAFQPGSRDHAHPLGALCLRLAGGGGSTLPRLSVDSS